MLLDLQSAMFFSEQNNIKRFGTRGWESPIMGPVQLQSLRLLHPLRRPSVLAWLSLVLPEFRIRCWVISKRPAQSVSRPRPSASASGVRFSFRYAQNSSPSPRSGAAVGLTELSTQVRRPWRTYEHKNLKKQNIFIYKFPLQHWELYFHLMSLFVPFVSCCPCVIQSTSLMFWTNK